MNPKKQDVDLDRIFCMIAKKYSLEKLLLKAVATVESSLNYYAYRFEPGFWDMYLKNNPEWNTMDPKEVSASYGLMQLMYTTAHSLGFRGKGEELYDPIINIELGAKLLSKILKEIIPMKINKVWPIDIALARYNGGKKGNPGPDGNLRNYAYVQKVKSAYWKLKANEKECE